VSTDYGDPAEYVENIELFTRAANMGGSKIAAGDVMQALRTLGLRFTRTNPDVAPADRFRELTENTPRVPCAREACGRPIIQRTTDGEWVHIAPDGSVNRMCRSAAYDDPKPGDEGKREWLDWPRSREKNIAHPGPLRRRRQAR